MKLNQIWARIKADVVSDSQKVVNVVGTVLKDIEPTLKQDLETIITDGIPIVIKAFTLASGGGLEAASIAATEAGVAYIKAEIPTVTHEAATVLGAELSAQAKVLLPITVINPIPSTAGGLGTIPPAAANANTAAQ